MGNKIRLDGKKHSMLREFVKVLDYLESIEGVENVRPGRFADKGIKNRNGFYSIKYYDPTTRTIKLEVRSRQNTEQFFLEINPDYREYIESRFDSLDEFL